MEQNNEIQLKRNENILRLKIIDEDGNYTGNYLEFDMLNPEYLLNYQTLIEQDKKNREWFNRELTVIKKRPDKKGKKLYSYNEEELLKLYMEFCKKTRSVYDAFLGEGGLDKLLCGRAISLNTMEEIDDIIENAIAPKLQLNIENIQKKIAEKYSNKKSSDVIE